SSVCHNMPLMNTLFNRQPDGVGLFYHMLGLRNVNVWEQWPHRIMARAVLGHAGPSPLNAYANAMAHARWTSAQLDAASFGVPIRRTQFVQLWAHTSIPCL